MFILIYGTQHKIAENILYIPLILDYLTWNKRK